MQVRMRVCDGRSLERGKGMRSQARHQCRAVTGAWERAGQQNRTLSSGTACLR